LAPFGGTRSRCRTYDLAAGGPDQHVFNHPFLKTDTGLWIWSGNMGNLVLSALILIVGGLWFAKQVKTGPEARASTAGSPRTASPHMIEVICVYLREESSARSSTTGLTS
jgi:hypothetical protein